MKSLTKLLRGVVSSVAVAAFCVSGVFAQGHIVGGASGDNRGRDDRPPHRSGGRPDFNSFTDRRDGRTYRIVVIGRQRWMGENLNYQTDNSWCANNDNSKCSEYGRLYDWKTARTVCPAGWHLPSRQEWDTMLEAVGGDNVAGKKLKSTHGWDGNGNGTDDYGFSAQPGGERVAAGNTFNAGKVGFWWTDTEHRTQQGWVNLKKMYYGNNKVEADNNGKFNGFSVRCIAD